MLLTSFALLIVAVDVLVLIGTHRLPATPGLVGLGFLLPLALCIIINLTPWHHARMVAHGIRSWTSRRRESLRSIIACIRPPRMRIPSARR